MVPYEKKLSSFQKFFNKNIILTVFIVSSVFIILYKFIFINYEEIFKHASKLGEIFYNIAFALLASSIFYYFVVYLKEKENKRKVRQLINMRFEQIRMMKYLILNDIKKKSPNDTDKKDTPKSKADLVKILKGMKLTDKPPSYFAGSQMVELDNWYQYFEYNFNYDIKNIDLLYRHTQFLNPETIQLMHDLISAPLIGAIHQYEIESRSKDYAIKFENLSGPLFHYLNILDKFKKDSWK
ncbi:MAG: hypothetical protein ACOCP4_02325 [Candidatus Woesearchaeota archaeon]